MPRAAPLSLASYLSFLLFHWVGSGCIFSLSLLLRYPSLLAWCGVLRHSWVREFTYLFSIGAWCLCHVEVVGFDFSEKQSWLWGVGTLRVSGFWGLTGNCSSPHASEMGLSRFPHLIYYNGGSILVEVTIDNQYSLRLTLVMLFRFHLHLCSSLCILAFPHHENGWFFLLGGIISPMGPPFLPHSTGRMVLFCGTTFGATYITAW